MVFALMSLVGFVTHYAETLSDFSAFYVAGSMAAAQNAQSAYDLAAFRTAYGAIFPGAPAGYGWFYPPTFLLLHEPLAAMPFQWARGLWLVAGFGLYMVAMRSWMTRWQHWLLAATVPAIAFHWHSGQTGFLMAALLAFALVGLNRNNVRGDWQAGVAIGLLTIKPHLWLLIPVFLAIERRWRVIGVAGLTAALLFIMSVAIYGLEPWFAMIKSAANGYTDNHAEQLHLFAKMGNISGFLRYWGWDAMSAPILFLWAVSATLVMAALTRVRAPLALCAAFAVLASFIIAPHNMIYDQTIFVPICAMVIASTQRFSWSPVNVSMAILLSWPALFAIVPGLDAFPYSVVIVALAAITFAATGLQRPRRHTNG